MEVDKLNNRVTNIKQAYFNTKHNGLRERLSYENKSITKRLNEIHSISKFLEIRTNTKISFSGLLVETCERTIAKARLEKNLFFL